MHPTIGVQATYTGAREGVRIEPWRVHTGDEAVQAAGTVTIGPECSVR